MIYRPRRFVAAIASSTLALLDAGAGRGRRAARTGRRDRHARRESLCTRHRRSGGRRFRRAAAERRRCRDQPGAGGYAALVQLSAAGPCRRHRHDPPRDAARSGARSDAGAGQRQAAPAASLVNVNGTVGRGSSAVDLNTIPDRRSCSRSKCCATARRRSTAPMRLPACSTFACAKRTKAATRPSATAGATRATTCRPPRPTIASPAPC